MQTLTMNRNGLYVPTKPQIIVQLQNESTKRSLTAPWVSITILERDRNGSIAVANEGKCSRNVYLLSVSNWPQTLNPYATC